MKKILGNIFWAVITIIVIAVAFSFLAETGKKPVELTLNEVAQKINQGEVGKIVISGNKIDLQLKDGGRAVSQKEAESGLTETLKNLGVSQQALQNVALEIKEESGFVFWLRILIPTLLPLIVIIILFWMIFRRAQGGVNQAFTFGRSNVRLSTPRDQKTTFKDVAGLEEAKEELKEIVDFLKNPKKYTAIGARIPRGVLLMGPPGTGKTLIARAVAGESGVPFFYISASEFVEMFVGVGASRIRDAFATAKKAAPSILFIDEIDAVGRERGAGLGGGHDEREQALNQILVEMDGFDNETQVIVLAATNRPDILDRALLRPGRFDRRVVLDMPDVKEREAILKIHAAQKKLADNVNLKDVAVRTPGFSGADLANVINEAAIFAARKNKRVIEQADLLEAIEKVMLGPEKKSRVLSEREKKITAYHEAGHALVAASLKDADPVHKVTIVGRGIAGGYTLKLPTEETRLKTKSKFLADLATMMGGYAAEKELFNDITTGASNDIKQASEIARSLVTKYGMSEKLGPIAFGKSQELVFLGKEISSEKNYSEETARKIDEEVNNFITRAYNTAKRIIKSRKDVLDAIAKALMEKETLEKEEFYNLLKEFKLKKVGV